MQKLSLKNKKGGVVSSTVQGTGQLIIGVVIILVVVSTLLGANLLTSGSEYDNVTSRMSANFTSGIDEISAKIPTILLIVAVVFLFGALLLLVRNSNAMSLSGGGSL